MPNYKAFQKKVYEHYVKANNQFPWRKAHFGSKEWNPYHTLISEIMLQQTQVDRVSPKFTSFITRFPTPQSLADASTHDLFDEWQGLGYNRRALMLQKCAVALVSLGNTKESFPNTVDEMKKLPGIGPYTAAAISAFAFNKPVVVIETNIRTAMIHEFFPDRQNVTDEDMIPFIEKTLDTENPCKWYNALMDYGAMLKRTHGNLSRKSKEYVKQSTFKGSDREIRGEVLRIVLKEKKISLAKLSTAIKKYSKDTNRILKILEKMQKDEIISFDKVSISLK